MLSNILKLLPLLSISRGMWFAENEGDKGDKSDEGKNGETVSKADYDKLVADKDKLSQDLEDMRMEILSPEYMDFLHSKESKEGTKGEKTDTEHSDDTLSDDKIEKMSKKEILAIAEKNFQAKLDKIVEEGKADKNAQSRKEVAAFARAHEDFETYRPIMYGLSCDPKNADRSLSELFKMAKDHVARIHTAPTEEEKNRQKKMKGEKPGGNSESYDRLKKLSPEEAASEAMKETKEKHGIESFPLS